MVARPLNLIVDGRTRYQVTAETISAQDYIKEQAIAKEVIDSQNVRPSAKEILRNEEHQMLYLADFHIEYPASMSQRDFFSIWAREAEAALDAKKAGVVIDIWKCVGSRRVVAVAKVDSPDTLDKILLDLPIMKEHGQHVQVEVTPLRPLEDFATDLRKRLE